MKVLNLRCVHQHAFEGWFGSEDDFQSQLERRLVECPLCGSAEVVKLLSAPRLNLGANKPVQEAMPAKLGVPTAPVASEPSAAPELQAAWLKLVQHVMTHTEDVGTQFAEEARKMHYGEADERAIRGQASPQETEALIEEGIAVMPLPIPAALKGTLQ